MAPTFFKASCVSVLPPNQANSPEVLFTTFSTIPRVVDFPLPFGPKIPYTLPFSMVKDRLSTAVSAPYFLVRSLRLRIVSKIEEKFKV